MQATLFSHWIFRHLKLHASRLEVGHSGADESARRVKKEEG
jgi:hypothetical protein